MSHELPANQPAPPTAATTVAAAAAVVPRRWRWVRWSLWLGVLCVFGLSVLSWQSRGPSVDEIERELEAVAGGAGIVETEPMINESILNLLPTEWANRMAQWRFISKIYVLDGGVTDTQLTLLGKLTGLKSLTLFQTDITDAGLIYLSGLTKLEYLDLSSSKVTDAGLAYLSGLTKLKTLELNYTQITDAGLVDLRGLTNLEKLDLRNTQVTDAAKTAFREQHPNCSVE